MKRLLLTFILLAGCKEVYQPDINASETGNLVVEANITGNGDSTFVLLSRTRFISDTTYNITENNASVSVEGENGEIFPLAQVGDGVYSAASLNVSIGSKYKLNIQTIDGNVYNSDLVTLINTPPIDSVSWKKDENNNVNIYANTHDPQNNTLYYRWEFVQTWEHRATYTSYLIYDENLNDIRLRTTDENIDRCWTIFPSSSIYLASSAGLSSDVISLAPLTQIPYGDVKLSIVYSILVKQYALTKEGFQYWVNLKKNNEQLGSIFDPQPSADNGNVHCITDPTKTAIGFVTASTLPQKRIYIRRSEVGVWPQAIPTCNDTTVAISDFIEFFRLISLPVSYGMARGTIFASSPECVDCRISGGSTVKPPYMP